MKRLTILTFLALGIEAFSQQDLNSNTAQMITRDNFSGIITGQVKTTDGRPAPYVNISVAENSRVAMTDENGQFTIKNLKQGTYTLQISMIGLRSQQKTVQVKDDQTSFLTITLTEDEKQLTEVVVSSGRRLNSRPLSIGKIDIDPMDLPQSISVVGSGLIREQQAQRLSDVVKNINGVYVTGTRGAVSESLGARGYGFGSTNLFKNGARVNAAAMPEMSSLEKVEVLKGSAAILFGEVAPGGILNMVTKQPKFNSGGEVSMRAGSYGLYKPSFDVYGPVSTSVAYRLNGVYETAASFRDDVHSKRYYINPSLLFRIGNNTELVAEGDYLYHRFTPDFGIGSLDGTKIPDVPRSRFLGTPWQYSKTQQSTSTLTLKHSFSEDWKVNSSLSYQRYSRDYFAVERIQADANGDWTRPLGRILSSENYYAAQVNLNGRFYTASVEHTLLAGADADHDLTTNHDFSFPAVAGLPAKSYDVINILDPEKYTPRTDIPEATKIRRREAPENRFGIYVQDLVKLSEKFNLLAGIRWTLLQNKGIDSTNLIDGNKTSGADNSQNEFSPRFGLVYKPFKTTSVFASYSTSFVANRGQDIQGNPLQPSLIDQYELGVKNEFFNGLLSANLTAYRIINNNLAQTAPFLADGSQNNNTGIKQLTGQTTSDGVELDLASHPIKGLDITAGYSYNFMRYTKTDTTVGSYKTGERLVDNPAHTANASVFYTVSKGILNGFKTGLTIAYTGERNGGWNNSVASTSPLVYRERLFPVDEYTTIDISAGYRYKKLSLMARVSNLTNTLNYYVHENYSINPIPPTQFIATVSYRW